MKLGVALLSLSTVAYAGMGINEAAERPDAAAQPVLARATAQAGGQAGKRQGSLGEDGPVLYARATVQLEGDFEKRDIELGTYMFEIMVPRSASPDDPIAKRDDKVVFEAVVPRSCPPSYMFVLF
ncbi:hypothetical protein BS50DRAFT_578146 [Corynespora cassiicola Philippines]|uniref:Uncharacterized protein n=1 Tax=Corynespora cassiicola Philippines TaxID=1448308 RepID=A0A2T2NAC1_CORCC|nr:hypothetical protein BS50DRAFT_578146 [Corynespora cassiicola Philippines]